MISIRIRVRGLFLAGVLSVFGLSGAEPTVDPTEMPRIPPTEPGHALDTFRVKPGFHLELAAHEPLVVDPVTMCFDEEGRLFVVEMIDYSERRDEDPHLGRVRLLTDTDGDGRFDQATVYADALPWPTAIVCYDGGVFVGATPDIIWCRDLDGDGRADERKVVFTGFGAKASRLNVQGLFNSFQWGLDNRIHGTCGTISGNEIIRPDRPDVPPLKLQRSDFSFEPRTLDLRSEHGGGQYGMSFDTEGRKFLCSNSDHAQLSMYGQREVGQSPLFAMPSHRVSIAEDGRAAEVFRLSPDEPWRIIRTRWRISGVVRGMVEGGGRVSGYFTGATGLTVFQGDAYGKAFENNLFVGDAGGNLVHRKRMDHRTLPPVARRPADEQKREFIASTDNWFRPVHFANGPDGCLYIADMYRETIEHPWSLPEPIKKHLDLNSGNDRGRIYRVVPDGFQRPKRTAINSMPVADRIRLLDHANGWTRSTASRLLYQGADATLPRQLNDAWERMGRHGRVHTLNLHAALGSLTAGLLAQALTDPEAAVRIQAIKLLDSERYTPSLLPVVKELVMDPSLEVRYRAALALGRIDMPEEFGMARRLLEEDGANPWIRAAVLGSLSGRTGELLAALPGSALATRVELARMTGASGSAEQVGLALTSLAGRLQDAGTPAILKALDEGLRQKRQQLARFISGTPLDQRFQELISALAKVGSAKEDIVPKITLLAAAGHPIAGETLRKLLDARYPTAVRQASVRALLDMPETGAFEAILANWSLLDAADQRAVVRNSTSHRTRAGLLLEAIAQGTVSGDSFDPTSVDALRRHRELKIASLAGKLFGPVREFSPAAVVQAYGASLEIQGDAAAGWEIFRHRCSTCHRASGEGYPLGPDMVTVKAKGRENLLLNIVHPNAEVAPQYMAFEIETSDDESYTALLGAESPTHVTLRMAGGLEKSLVRRAIRGMRSQGRSLMPEGLQEGLSVNQMADLLRFIETIE